MNDSTHTRGSRTHIPFAIPTEWTAEQALAIVELLDDLRERIWQHYHLPLHERTREQYGPPLTSRSVSPRRPFRHEAKFPG